MAMKLKPHQMELSEFAQRMPDMSLTEGKWLYRSIEITEQDYRKLEEKFGIREEVWYFDDRLCDTDSQWIKKFRRWVAGQPWWHETEPCDP